MQVKMLSRRAFVTGIFVGVVLPVAIFLYCIPKILAQSDTTVLSASVLFTKNSGAPAVQSSYGLPTRIRIPTISVDTAVESVGLTSGGEMDLMKNPNNVAWYQLGPRPGEKGSAVIAGHSGIWKSGKAALFEQLHTVQPGDKIVVEDDKGVSMTFVVRGTKSYDPTADASEVFISHDGKAHLNLITCEGDWNEASKSYPKRLVVFTDKE